MGIISVLNDIAYHHDIAYSADSRVGSTHKAVKEFNKGGYRPFYFFFPDWLCDVLSKYST